MPGVSTRSNPTTIESDKALADGFGRNTFPGKLFGIAESRKTERARAKSAKAEVRKAPLSNAASKPKAKRKFNKPLQSAGGGKVKRIRAGGAKAVKAKSVLSNNPQDDKLG